MNEEKLRYIANFLAEWVFQHLVSATDTDRVTARIAAVDAGNAAARAVEQTLAREAQNAG